MVNIFCYQHHINDWRRDTADLSLEERGAYRELLDWYYSTGGKLPADLPRLYRVLAVQTQSERRAIATVSKRFFTVTADGFLRQKRAENEIAKINSRSEKAALSARARYNNNNDLGSANAEQTHSERTANDLPTNNQEPISDTNVSESPLTPQHDQSTDSPVVKTSKSFKPEKMDMPDWLPPDTWSDWCAHRVAIKSPMTKRAAELTIKNLSDLHRRGCDVVRTVEHAIERGWRGIYEMKDQTPIAGTFSPQTKKTYADTVSAAMNGAIRNLERAASDEIF